VETFSSLHPGHRYVLGCHGDDNTASGDGRIAIRTIQPNNLKPV